MNEIILDQIAIWTPKATDGCSRRVSPAGVNYRAASSKLVKRSDRAIYRFAKNYFLGGESAEVPVVEAETEIIEEPGTAEVQASENTEEVSENAEEAVEVVEEISETSLEEEATESKIKFCLFVRTFEDSADIERKLDEVAKKITEQEALAAIGRVQSSGPMSFEYTKYNLGDID